MKVGIIGIGVQAKKIIAFLKNDKANQIIQNHYKKKKNCTNRIEELFNAECIFIASPTFTHISYLTKISKYKGYIFLEKPGASKKKEINFLIKKLSNKKIYINYNFVFSNIYKILKNMISTKKYGKILKFQITQSNGVALKKNYFNWRFDKKKCNGIEEINTVHFIHLILCLFNKIKFLSKFTQSISQKNIDNADYNFISGNNCLINIFNSYTTPVINSFKLIFVNALVDYDGKFLKISYPWNVTNKIGRLISPAVKHKIKLDFSSDWALSNSLSIKYFLNHVKKNRFFKKTDLFKSIKTLEIIHL